MGSCEPMSLQGQDPLILSIPREDILPLTRREVEGNSPVFKTFQTELHKINEA
jgi:hypothetical protein